jgi:hypothetical protein
MVEPETTCPPPERPGSSRPCGCRPPEWYCAQHLQAMSVRERAKSRPGPQAGSVVRAPASYALPPGPPRAARMWAVRYETADGENATRLFWQRRAARRCADRVAERGGEASVWEGRIGEWTEWRPPGSQL